MRRCRGLLAGLVGGVAVCVVLTDAASATSESSSGLYVVSPNGGTPRKVVDACVENFAWSPDGRSIAYTRLVNDDEPDPATEVIRLANGRVRRLASDGRPEPPTWSPDGSRIAFGADGDIFVASSAAKGTPRVVNRNATGYWPAWSPDGKRIAFDAFSGRVATVSPSGGAVKYLRRTKTGLAVPVLWFPNGKRLLYKSDVGSLNAVNVDGTGTRSVVAGPTSGHGGGFAISPDGKRIAYTTDRGTYLKSATGSGRRFLAAAELGGWSPDGKRLVVVADGVYVVNQDGTGQRKIAPRASADGFYIGQPIAAWSSRGEIAYMDTAGTCGGPS